MNRNLFNVRKRSTLLLPGIASVLLILALSFFSPAAVRAEIPATTQPATRPAVHDPLNNLPSYGSMVRRTAYTLFGIIAGVVILAKVLQRWTGVGRRPLSRSRLIEVIEYHRLEPRKAIYLIRVAGNYFLIGSTHDRLETLAGSTLDPAMIAAALSPQPPASTGAVKSTAASPSRAFLEVLRGKRNESV